MTTIVTRAGKGTALTFAEMDANLTNLNNDKVEANTNATFSGVTITGLSDGIVKATTGTFQSATAGIDYQVPLVSGTNIKTVNSTSLLGSGNVAVQDVLVSGTNIKTVNGTTLLGSGDITIATGGDASTNTATSVDGEVTLFSGTGGKTLKRATQTGIATVTSGVLGTAVSGTDLKTINGVSIIGSGDISISGAGGDVTGPASSVDNELTLFSGTTGKVIKRATTTGIVKATDGVISAATSGTDYSAGTAALSTGLLKSTTGTGALSIAVADTDYLAPAAIGVTVQGYDVNTAKTNVANSWTAQQTFTETKDTVYTITDGAAFEIDPVNGSIQVVTLGASRTPAATNFEAGQTVLLGIDDGTAYSITWTTVNPTWVKPGGTATAPTLATTGYTWILFWKVGTTIYGAEVGKP